MGLHLSGVYQIYNKANGKVYIGSSASIQHRFAQHKYRLRKGTHNNAHLQCSWNKYGEESFEFKPLLYCDLSNVLYYEQTLLDGMRHEYNTAPFAEASHRGVKASEKTLAKMRTRCGQNSSMFGKHHTPETKRKMSEAQKGRHPSEETRRKLSVAKIGVKRLPFSKETRSKLSAVNMGNKHSVGRYRGTKIICLETGVVYNSMGIAEKELGLSKGYISFVVTGRRESKCGLRFQRYIETKEQGNVENRG